MAKYVGVTENPYDIVNKKYVDAKDASLDASIAYVLGLMEWSSWE